MLKGKKTQKEIDRLKTDTDILSIIYLFVLYRYEDNFKQCRNLTFWSRPNSVCLVLFIVSLKSSFVLLYFLFVWLGFFGGFFKEVYIWGTWRYQEFYFLRHYVQRWILVSVKLLMCTHKFCYHTVLDYKYFFRELYLSK